MINKYPTIFWYILFLFLNLCRQYIHFIASNQGRLCPLPALGIPLPSLWRLCRFSFHPAPRKPPAFFCNNAMLWEVASVMPDSLRPYGLSPPVCGILQARILKWVAMPFSRDLPDSGIEPASLTSPALQVESLPLAPPEKPSSIIDDCFSALEPHMNEIIQKIFFCVCLLLFSMFLRFIHILVC